MSEQEFREQMDLLKQARALLLERVGQESLTKEEEELIKKSKVMPKLPKKLFTRSQMIDLVAKVMLAGQLLYNERKQPKARPVDRTKKR